MRLFNWLEVWGDKKTSVFSARRTPVWIWKWCLGGSWGSDTSTIPTTAHNFGVDLAGYYAKMHFDFSSVAVWCGFWWIFSTCSGWRSYFRCVYSLSLVSHLSTYATSKGDYWEMFWQNLDYHPKSLGFWDRSYGTKQWFPIKSILRLKIDIPELKILMRV